MNLSGQDWGEVVIRKKAPTGASAHSAAAINAAIKAGGLTRREGGAVTGAWQSACRR